MNSFHKQSTNGAMGHGRKRITSQSQAILSLIKTESGHMTAEMVYERVKITLPRISLATVYRNLHQLAEAELIGRVLVDGLWRFEAETSEHYHVMCVACNRLDNLQVGMASDVEQFFGRWTDYQLTGHEILLFGVCGECRRGSRR